MHGHFQAFMLFLRAFFKMMTEEGVFSIITSYLRLAEQGAEDFRVSSGRLLLA